MVVDRKDSVVEIPYTRWDVDAYFDKDADAPGKRHARHGGFIDGADLFDLGMFALSAAEASTIDPQQRLILEVAITAFTMGAVEVDEQRGRCLRRAVPVRLVRAQEQW